MYFLGFDIGSSSIKAALIDGASNQAIKIVTHPETEMGMISKTVGWAEQDPEIWWESVCEATKKILKETAIDPELIKGIGIAYQMHGLVVVDKKQKALRPSIIWCDSRAISIGAEAFQELGHQRCFNSLLNSPGNFTASKLKWVKENEPEIFAQIHKIMLPGDFIAMKMTGTISTTIAGLSEGMLWDFETNTPAHVLLEHYGISPDLIPEVKPVFSVQGRLNEAGANALGLPLGVPVGYRAGDQPNNAMSLGVLEPGEIAATGGTSGVVYGLSSTPVYDDQSRINSFAHVNYTPENPNVGALLCINGAGIQYRWINQQIAQENRTYEDLENSMKEISIGAEGLSMLPFGNGGERMLGNKELSASIHNLQFNLHSRVHLYRAALEGIAFAFVYGINILKGLNLDIQKIRVGNDNLFQSEIFSSTISTLTGSKIEIVETTGAIGAARAVGYTIGHFSSLKEAMSGDKIVRTFLPEKIDAYQMAYDLWKAELDKCLV